MEDSILAHQDVFVRYLLSDLLGDFKFAALDDVDLVCYLAFFVKVAITDLSFFVCEKGHCLLD